MTRQAELKAFLRRYFGVFIGAFFASIIAVAWTFALAWSTYCRSCSQDGLFPLGLYGLFALFVLGHGAVVRGRAWGMWLVAGMCVACMMITVPIYGHRPNLFIYTGSLLAALVALLLLNSRRYREMRLRLAEYRQQRRQARR
ncbi:MULTISPECIES: hypothetical protein [unclassified Pseudomonas]|uniref:hypothetical protein n=1 Tax=unclassified Pseudomonas TaxID=196821 RepID=UPI00244D3D0D|nr:MULTISPECIES: hypothetical protein [unclassified Pseudomonas]MDH0301280.1 hypothetical protein [Pseudomonas sp. GD04091]MDH1984650.1 hypothetical protein [Pseudomonas sp. GD03689]